MAAVTGTIKSAANFRTPAGCQQTSSGVEIIACDLYVTYETTTDTYAQGANATNITSASIVSAIQGARRDGKTPTLLSAGACAGGTENAVNVFPYAVNVSAGAVRGQLYTLDASSEHANAAMSATWQAPVAYTVYFYNT